MPACTSAIVVGELADRLLGAQQRDAAARHDAFLDRGAGGVERVLDAILLFLDLDLGGAADADHRDAAGEFGQPLLQLLAVIVGGGLFDLRLDLLTRASISFFLPAPSTMVVFSFSITTFLARPSMATVTFSSLMPRSSE